MVFFALLPQSDFGFAQHRKLRCGKLGILSPSQPCAKLEDFFWKGYKSAPADLAAVHQKAQVSVKTPVLR
jgi:hypothetical protein